MESDLSAFHRIDDWRELAAPRFFRLAVRVAAYTGVMAARAEAERAEERPGGAAPAASRGGARHQGATQDPNLLSKLESEGWLEHHVIDEKE